MSESKKPMSLFDHLSNVCEKKTDWNNLSDVDKKSFSSFMVNRFLSMNMDYVELVNEFQKYTVGILEDREVYKLYSDILPKKKQFNKYIKGKKEEKYNDELVSIVSKHFLISRTEAIDYLDILYIDRLNTVVELLKKYGKSDKEVKNLIK